MNPLEKYNLEQARTLSMRIDFEKTHREFLNDDTRYFINGVDGALVFWPGARGALRDHFGRDWSLRDGVIEKVVDGVTLRLLRGAEEDAPQEQILI